MRVETVDVAETVLIPMAAAPSVDFAQSAGCSPFAIVPQEISLRNDGCESEVAQICAAIVANAGRWFIATRCGQRVPRDLRKQMSEKETAYVAVRGYRCAAEPELLRTVRGIIAAGPCPVHAQTLHAFAGAMSFPPGIQKAVLRFAEENRGMSWPELISELAEIFSIRTVLDDPSQSVGGGSFARSKVVPSFRKEAIGRGKEKLRDEIRFLASRSEPLRALYPAVLKTEEPDEHSLVMHQEFVPWPTVRAHLLQRGTDPAEIIERLRHLLYHLKRISYDVDTQPTPPDYIDRRHFQRVRARTKLTCDLCPAFRRIAESAEIVLNGHRLEAPLQILAQLESSPLARDLATPKTVSPHGHGDLHFENILFDTHSPEAKLVDPRGYDLCDLYYDLGKLSHSVNGKYDLIHEDLFSLSWRFRGDVLEAQLAFPEDAARIYNEIGIHLRTWAYELTHDPKALGKMLFNEAMHFAADMPFHLANDGLEARATAIFLTGAKLLNQFKRDWL